jgi:AraC-like DNA-binding protein
MKGRPASRRVSVQGLYLRQLADLVAALGGEVGPWLAQSGLSGARLAAAEVTLDLEQLLSLLANAAAVTGEPALGLLVGQRLGVATHGAVGFAAVCSGTVREGLGVLVRYGPLRTSLVSVALEPSAHGLRVRFDLQHDLGDLAGPVLEAIVLSVKDVLESASGGACRAREVCFPFAAPPHAALARELFGAAPVRYGASWAGFELPEASLDAPLRTADPEAFRDAAAICQRQLEQLATDESVAARVRRLLLDGAERPPSLRLAARLLHLSPRTLHRRLVEEGTSFRALVEDVRRGLAVEYLRSGRFGVDDVAHRLGYSEVANFRRAFKRWERVSPSAFRARGRGRG